MHPTRNAWQGIRGEGRNRAKAGWGACDHASELDTRKPVEPRAWCICEKGLLHVTTGLRHQECEVLPCEREINDASLASLPATKESCTNFRKLNIESDLVLYPFENVTLAKPKKKYQLCLFLNQVSKYQNVEGCRIQNKIYLKDPSVLSG